jgi:formate dehydrogenase beta subunit
MVITAIGQSPDVSFTERTQKRLAELKTTRWNTIDVDPKTLQSNIPYLFAAGDAATGPSLVVEAIGGGRRAARSIHQYVMGQKVDAEAKELGKDLIAETIFDHVDGVIKNARAPMPELPVHERIHSFVEVDQVLTEKSALGESKRCLACCLTCYDKDAAASIASGIKDTGMESEAA